jgi:hypothetical protein
MRQQIDHGSWFDRSDMGLKKSILDVQYVCRYTIDIHELSLRKVALRSSSSLKLWPHSANVTLNEIFLSMNPKNGSFFIDPRLQRHFVTFASQVLRH